MCSRFQMNLAESLCFKERGGGRGGGERGGANDFKDLLDILGEE